MNSNLSILQINTYKIRQQLQFLRDIGIIEFKGNGNYRKI